jgi:hypothetical protein
VIRGGDGGGGHGSVTPVIEPSGHVCIAAWRGAVAHAETAAVATSTRIIRFILFSVRERVDRYESVPDRRLAGLERRDYYGISTVSPARES